MTLAPLTTYEPARPGLAGRRRVAAGWRAATRGGPAVTIAAVAWGTNGVALTWIPSGYHPAAVAAVTMLLGGVLLARSCSRSEIRSVLARPRQRSRLAVAAGSIAVCQVLYLSALRLTGVAVGTMVEVSAAPIAAGLLTLAVRRRRPSRRWMGSTALAVTGGSTLALAGGGGRGVDLAGLGCAVVAGVAYALFTTVSAALIADGADSRASMALSLVGSGALLSPALLVTPMGWLATPQGLVAAGYLAAVPTTVAYLLFGRGLRTVAATTASTLTLAEPAAATALGILVIGEQPTRWSCLGLALVTASLVILNWRPAGAHQSR